MLRMLCLWCVFSFVAPAAIAFTCAPPPAPVTRVISITPYAVGSSSIVDPAREQQRDEVMLPLNNYKEQLLAMTDLYLADPKANADAAQCALQWLRVWAEGNAMLGEPGGDKVEAEWEIRWALSGLAIGYLKVKPAADAALRAAVEPWLDVLARRVIQKQLVESRLRNNHYHWTGLALLSAGLALNQQEYIVQGKEIYLAALNGMDSDGAFPTEMKRKSKALRYDLFSLTALTMMAELSPKLGEDWYALENGKIFKAIRFGIAGLKNRRWQRPKHKRPKSG